ncbi:MAG: SDR family oxidoreductase [Acidobacteria bacterium]|nr:SDR family oxidoreductase [Acidobacteriota bacterium]
MSAGGELAGQVALVSGGSGGIGLAIIHALGQAGAEAVSLDLTAPGEEGIAWVKGDVRDDASVAAAVEEVFQRHGRLDLVIHAAGVTRDAVLWKLPVDDWDLVQAVNLRGAFLLLRHAVPALRRGKGGRIVLIGSINGSRGKFGLTAYASSKAGLIGLAKSAARETARFGILVNVVEPGMVRTPMTDALPQKVRDAAAAESLLGGLLEPADVAAAVLFLCGPGASQITGQILRVDGGQFFGGS